MQGRERYYAVHKWFEVKGNGRKFQTAYLGKSTLTGDYVYRYITPRDCCGFAWSEILSDLNCNIDEVTPRIIQKDDLSKHFNLDKIDYDDMKREYTKLFFKVKYSCGIYNRGNFFTFEGKSRLDGCPIYSCEAEVGLGSDWRFPYGDLIFQGRPGYTPTVDDFELITNTLEDHISPKRTNPLVSTELVEVKPLEVKPLGPPSRSGILYYMDYVYDEFDERLILML